jgi:REP element-mobilizing transposase RayT
MTETVINLTGGEPPSRYRFDYTGKHRYFITLPVFGHKEVFVEQRRVVAVLNALRDSALVHHFDVYAYCFLPSEMILVVHGKEKTSNMKTFVKEFRRQSSKALEEELGHALWKRKYLERVLRRDEDTREIVNSVFRRPVAAGLVRKPSEYPFQGSFVLVPYR